MRSPILIFASRLADMEAEHVQCCLAQLFGVFR